jgi:hypothetical protein
MSANEDPATRRIFEIKDVIVALPTPKEVLGDLVFTEETVYFIPLIEYDVSTHWALPFLGAAYPYVRASRRRKAREYASGAAERTRTSLVGESLESLAVERPYALRMPRACIRQIRHSWLSGLSILGNGLRFFQLPEGRKTYRKFEATLAVYLRDR